MCTSSHIVTGPSTNSVSESTVFSILKLYPKKICDKSETANKSKYLTYKAHKADKGISMLPIKSHKGPLVSPYLHVLVLMISLL